MKICPKCKFRDPPLWKHSRYGWDTQQDYCSFEEFKNWYPKLAEKLKETQKATDETCYYRLSKKGWVYRLAKEDEFFYHSHGYTEKPKHES